MRYFVGKGHDPLDEILKEAKRLPGRDRIKVFMELLGEKMGLNKPTAELSLEQLEAFKETIEKLISHREALEVLGDDEYC